MSEWVTLNNPYTNFFTSIILTPLCALLLKRLGECGSRILSRTSSRWAFNSARKEARILLRSLYLNSNPASMTAWVGSRVAILLLMVIFIVLFAWMSSLPFSGANTSVQFANRFVAGVMMVVIGASVIAALGSEIDAMSRMTDMQAMTVASAKRIREALIKSGKTEAEAAQLVNFVLDSKPRLVGLKDDPFTSLAPSAAPSESDVWS